MIVSIILDTEYMGMEARIKWLMKNLSCAVKNDYIIITHEYFKTHYEKLTQKCSERFYNEFEMRHISKEELEKIDVFYIPDSFFENLYRQYGTRSKMLVELSIKRNFELEGIIQEAIERGLKKRENAKVDYIMNCLHCFESIRYIGKRYSCPVIPYVFSAIRKVHGYQQTLYMANMSVDLFNNDEIQQLYKNYLPNDIGFELFSHEEILALLGKERNLPLLPLINEKGEFEIGIAKEGFEITPQSYYINYSTDDDIYYECKKYYRDDEIVTRLHPMQMDQYGLGRQHMKNDPTSFVLSCKRVATVHSQMIIKAVLWNRVACVFSDALPFSFLLTKKLNSNQLLDLKDVNFIVFCYFIPDSCMFSREYWQWRMEYPSANEIMIRHLKEIFNNLKYTEDVLYDKNERLKKILEGRGCDRYLIDTIKSKKECPSFCYRFLSSRLQIYYRGGKTNNSYCLNRYENGILLSKFMIEIKENVEYCVFYPFDDIDGSAKILDVNSLNSKVKYKVREDYIYYPKGQSDIKIDIVENNKMDLDIVISWIPNVQE